MQGSRATPPKRDPKASVVVGPVVSFDPPAIITPEAAKKLEDEEADRKVGDSTMSG